jgi:EmrB/QacA subfamily drug resistance transporter
MKRSNSGLLVLALAQLMVVLDIAIVNVALPSIQHAFRFGPDGLEWVANAYAVTFGGLLLLGGRSADRFGRLRLFLAGIAVFTAGSLAGGLAQAGWQLIAARAFQGVGAAIMSPAALSLLADTYTEGRERARALGVYSAVSAGGGAVGLLLGGVITTYLSWRWILFVNVPVGALLLIAAPRLLRALPGQAWHLDLPGAVAITAGAGLLAFGLSRAAVHGFGDAATEAALVIAVVSVAGFVAIEARAAEPLLPLRFLGDRNRSGALALSLAVGAVLSGLLFLLTLYLQNGLGFTPLRAGLAFLPTALGVGAGARLSSRLLERTGPRPLMLAGVLLATGALLWFGRLPAQAVYAREILPPLVLLAVGLGMVFVASTAAVIAGVGTGESGLASALLNMGRQLGGSLGIAGMATVAAGHGFDSAFKLGAGIAFGGFVAAAILLRRAASAPAEDRTAVVTGASHGIGPFLARALAARGYRVLVTARSAAELQRLAGELPGGIAVAADLTRPAGVDQLAAAAETGLGHVDLLVNNAGGEPQLEFDLMSWAENLDIVRLNLEAPMQLTHRLLPGMLARGRGHVVNVSSIAGHVAFPHVEAYAAAKDGLIGFTRVLRNDYRSRGVSASVLVLGAIRGAGQGQRTADELGLPLAKSFTSTPDQVAAALLRAVHQDRAEIVVMPGPGRALKAMLELLPGLGPALNRRSGTIETMRRVVTHRAQAREAAAAGEAVA